LKVALATAVVLVGLSMGASSVLAQSAEYCTGFCGGRTGGEAANTPPVVACYRKCMNGIFEKPGQQQPAKKKSGSNT
jgi:hypothetical protein